MPKNLQFARWPVDVSTDSLKCGRAKIVGNSTLRKLFVMAEIVASKIDVPMGEIVSSYNFPVISLDSQGERLSKHLDRQYRWPGRLFTQLY